MEHLEENGKPCLYLVFEFLSTDLKKWMDRNGKGSAHPLAPEMVKVSWGCAERAQRLQPTGQQARHPAPVL